MVSLLWVSAVLLAMARDIRAGSVATAMVYPDRTGEIYHLAFNPDQRWLYFPDMERNEVLLIKGYDSRTDGRARFVPHTAFHDPGSHADVFCAT